jgi:hypothetical protein
MTAFIYLSTETYDPISLMIRVVTHSKWSHIGFAEQMDDGSWRTLSAMFDGGVKYRAMPKQFILMTAPGVEEAYQEAKTQLGKPYDWRSILGIVMNRDWREVDSWYCAEIVAWAFEQVMQPLFNTSFGVNWITPRDFFLSPYVSEVKL